MSGPKVTLNDPTAVNPSFTALEVLIQRNLVFELIIINEQGIESQLDGMTITVYSTIVCVLGSGNNINI